MPKIIRTQEGAHEAYKNACNIWSVLCNHHQGQNYFVLLDYSSILVAPVVLNRDPLQIQSSASPDPFPQTGPGKVDLCVSGDNLETKQKHSK